MSEESRLGQAHDRACSSALDNWLHLANDGLTAQLRPYGSAVPDAVVEHVASEKSRLKELYQRAAVHLHYLAGVNPDTSPEVLDRIAEALSPSLSFRDGGLFPVILQHSGLCDPLLLAALIYRNAQLGQVGFQFLDDPATVDRGIYDNAATDFLDSLDNGLLGNPLRVLHGKDAEFYKALPDTITIYRGCSGIDAETAALGVCWTIHRAWADWFACRFATVDKPAVVVTARVPKSMVRLAMWAEQEVVTRPLRARQIKCRPISVRPERAAAI